jgi:hypothetical protein
MIDTPLVIFREKLGFCAFSGSVNIVYQFKCLYCLFFDECCQDEHIFGGLAANRESGRRSFEKYA